VQLTLAQRLDDARTDRELDAYAQSWHKRARAGTLVAKDFTR
jgi:hypothetical protein